MKNKTCLPENHFFFLKITHPSTLWKKETPAELFVQSEKVFGQIYFLQQLFSSWVAYSQTSTWSGSSSLLNSYYYVRIYCIILILLCQWYIVTLTVFPMASNDSGLSLGNLNVTSLVVFFPWLHICFFIFPQSDLQGIALWSKLQVLTIVLVS